MNRFCCVLLIVAMSLRLSAQSNEAIIFTEVCVANIDQTIDYSNNYGAWVELYNQGDQDVSLNEWYVSDDEANLTKHQLTGFDALKPGCYQCLFFDHNAADGEYGRDAAKQVRFKLARNGGTLYLSRDGSAVDLSITYPESIPRCSYARVNLDGDEWQYCGLPTPGQANAGHYAEECLPAPEVDCDSKLFTSEFEVHVQIPAGTTLRYTTDGSTPTLKNGLTSTDGLFPIAQNTVLRLRLFSDDKLPSSVVTRTYIYRRKSYYLPVVAIATDPRNLYDNKIGCYTDGTNGIPGRGAAGASNLNMDWERPVNFEYLTEKGKMAINQETSFEVAGGWSRHFKPASFKVQAKKLYDGNGHFDYPVFKNKPYQEYKQLMIRNGGNNNRIHGGSRILDAITQQVLTTSGFYVDAQEYQPAHVFINGKYLAMMNVREPTNRFHGVANYGYDEDEIDSFEYSNGGYQQKKGTRDAFDRMIQLSADAESHEGYARLAEVLDVDEFVRYMAAICYTGSSDWIVNNNNVKGYRWQDGGKFHFVFFDQDMTWDRSNNVEEIEADGNEVMTLYQNLKRNPTFRQQFVTAYCILHGSIYTPDRCQFIADSICALVRTALSYDYRYTTVAYRVLQKTMWEESHREARIMSLMNAYALSDSINVNLGTNCTFARIQIEDMDVPFSKFSGVLFGPVSVSTNAAEGYRFVGWRDQSGKWLSRERVCQITDDGTYTAVYEQAEEASLSPICINEVSAANNIFVNEYGGRPDWIELYNRGQEPVDVSGWWFSDDDENPTKYQIATLDQTSTVIWPDQHLVIWCDGLSSPFLLPSSIYRHQPHLPFKLKNADNSTLTIQSADGEWRDSLCYHAHSSKETVGRYPDGGNDFWTLYHPTIGTHNLATSYDRTNSDATRVRPLSQPESISYYTVSGIRTPKPQKGVNIIRYSDGTTRKVLMK